MTTHNAAFLNPQGDNRLVRAEIVIARKASTISPRQDVSSFSLTPDAGESDDEFKSLLLAELSEMIRSEEDPKVPYMYDLKVTESHLNWGASGDSISLLLEVSDAIPPAVIGFYVERILKRLGSQDDVLLTRDEAVETATSRVITAYNIERAALRQTGEEELRESGWRIHFTSGDGEVFKVDIDQRGVTYISRSSD